MIRLKDKREVKKYWKLLEEKFPNTPLQSYWTEAWNPSELPLPNPPDFEVTVRGADIEAMRDTARDLKIELEERKLFQRVRAEPNVGRDEALRVRPRVEQWPLLAAQGVTLSLYDLADLTRTATNGRTVTKVDLGTETMDVVMRFPGNYITTPEELSALPVGAGSRILPLKALAQVGLETKRPSIRRENGRDAYVLSARGEKDEAKKTKESVEKAKDIVERWPQIIAERKSKLAAMGSADPQSDPAVAVAVDQAKRSEGGQPVIQIEDAQKELTSALTQLTVAISLSILLIFLTMVFQFGSIMNSLLVLVAVPLGFIGVLISLFVFKSTLSLNSMLGVILLNGLAVANSIILVDFLAKKVKEGVAPRLAAIEVARVRLRPILMTSMTTGLGMLPIAFGFGEGGKILQPLGIAVAGGLLFSMTTTLFIVPSLQVSWMEFQARRTKMRSVSA
jgi:multidrug efflux pump subunit AcrB